MRETTSILPLTLADVTWAVDGRTLLTVAAAEIHKGRRTVVLGPNGAGKTLFLKLCHGLIRPTAGRVAFSGSGGDARAPKRHAMVFQKPVMLRRSVQGNLRHALGLAGVGFFDRRRQVPAILAEFGLAELAGRPARVLSGGEQQRLAIARAAAVRPELLFLDEPASALDPTATRQIEELLLRLHGEGLTWVMTTHDLAQARRLADDVLFFHGGRLLEAAPAATFFTAPRTEEARAFLESRLFW
ncbi:ATP-binding cassette domain-containing protein [Siculibacillus lacustris]|uniref:ATP-binding cassette domain-containing protein n=1 Tax=Siculibacillus lacustris TaxID=1549641 RepID=A0A4Q9VRB7_9HYPH|nr:ATP-binding cassette domain-containing protein [Siculibacillus lacustris]TBW38424.1 ATP-binding cassette domain-containing protein [Siculibacillus lacustris]